MRQHVDLYQNGELVARFTEGAAQADYFGAAGQIVKALVEADHCTYNPWEHATRHGGLQGQDFLWLLSSVEWGLHDSDVPYTYDVQGATPPFGVPYPTQRYSDDRPTPERPAPRVLQERWLLRLQTEVQEAVDCYMEEHPDDDMDVRRAMFADMEATVRALGEALNVPPPQPTK